MVRCSIIYMSSFYSFFSSFEEVMFPALLLLYMLPLHAAMLPQPCA